MVVLVVVVGMVVVVVVVEVVEVVVVVCRPSVSAKSRWPRPYSPQPPS